MRRLISYPMPVLDAADAAAAEAALAEGAVRLLSGTVVDPAGVTRAKHVPAARALAFHTAGMGASPSWNVFCIDNAIAFRPGFGVVGDLRLRADLAALRVLGDGLAWAPAEMVDQDGAPAPVCTRGLLRRTQAEAETAGLTALVGAELEFVVTERAGGPWNAYGLGPVLDVEPFVLDLVDMCAAAGVPMEQVHAEYADGQFEFSLRPTDPLAAADGVVLARLLAGRVARRHGLTVSFSPQPSPGAPGTAAHQHLSLFRDGVPLFSGGAGPHGLTPEGEVGDRRDRGRAAGAARRVRRVGAVRAPVQPGHWSGAHACWGLENREAAVRLCAATPGNPQGASVEVKCIDPSANPYLATAAGPRAGGGRRGPRRGPAARGDREPRRGDRRGGPRAAARGPGRDARCPRRLAAGAPPARHGRPYGAERGAPPRAGHLRRGRRRRADRRFRFTWSS